MNNLINLIKLIKENGEEQYLEHIVLPENIIFKFNGYFKYIVLYKT